MRLILLFIASITFAQTVPIGLKWDANQEPDISHYLLYLGIAHGQYGDPLVIEDTQVVVSLPKVLHYAAVSAVNTSGAESGKSKELCFQVALPMEITIPSNPTGFEKTGPLSLSIEQSKDLKSWASIYQQTINLSESSFFRLVLSQ